MLEFLEPTIFLWNFVSAGFNNHAQVWLFKRIFKRDRSPTVAAAAPAVTLLHPVSQKQNDWLPSESVVLTIRLSYIYVYMYNIHNYCSCHFRLLPSAAGMLAHCRHDDSFAAVIIAHCSRKGWLTTRRHLSEGCNFVAEK